MVPINMRYVEWQSADEIHDTSKHWLSELQFVQDEHLFFNDLITLFTLQLIQPNHFLENKELIKEISTSQKRNEELILAVNAHERNLKLLVDGVNQIEEEKAYTEEHRRLMTEISVYLDAYKTLKTKLFEIIKTIKKADKHKHLISKK